VTVTLADIEAARRAIAGHVVRTPMLPAPKLSALTGASVRVKYENMQVTNSFKERGALNKLAALGAAERARGVIAMSAGTMPRRSPITPPGSGFRRPSSCR
jgi:threonine dehydratase